MSRRGEETITCPCGHSAPFTIWSSLNVTLDPAEKPKVIDRSLFQFTCSKCSHSSTVVYPFLYHDMEQRTMVWLLPQAPGAPAAQPEQMPPPMGDRMRQEGYRFRSVRTHNELIEKIFIFDAGLEDGAIEMLKPMMRKNLDSQGVAPNAEIYFSGLRVGPPEGLEFAVVADGKGAGALGFDKQPMYDNLLKAWQDAAAALNDQTPWPRVDLDYVLRAVEAVEAQPRQGRGAGRPPAYPSGAPSPRIAKKPWWKLW